MSRGTQIEKSGGTEATTVPPAASSPGLKVGPEASLQELCLTHPLGWLGTLSEALGWGAHGAGTQGLVASRLWHGPLPQEDACGQEPFCLGAHRVSYTLRLLRRGGKEAFVQGRLLGKDCPSGARPSAPPLVWSPHQPRPLISWDFRNRLECRHQPHRQNEARGKREGPGTHSLTLAGP